MLLAIDVGNTNIVIGIFVAKNLDCVFQLKTDQQRTVDEYSALLLPLLEHKLGSQYSIQAAIICSVVPPMTASLVALTKELFGVDPLVLGPGIRSGLPLRVKEPSALGADRVANAVAAKAKSSGECVVVDFGTATTLDYINGKGEYEGGIIVPGLQVAAEALFAKAAKLSCIELSSWPTRVIGNDTASAVQSGTLFGYACLVEGLLAKIEEEQQCKVQVYTTGTYGKLFSEHCPRLANYEANLLLEGLRIIAENNDMEWSTEKGSR